MNLTKLKSKLLFNKKIINFLINIKVLNYERNFKINHHYSITKEHQELEQLIPKWHEFNDQLYWQSIEFIKQYESNVVNDQFMSYLGNLWKFDIDDFERVIEYVQNIEPIDYKLIAFDRAFSIYSQNGKAEWMLEMLERTAKKYPVLLENLAKWLEPIIDDELAEWQQESEKYQRESEEQEQKEELERCQWIQKLRDNPNQLGEIFTTDHMWLMYECGRTNEENTDNYANNIDWKSLIYVFGESVANVFRDSAIKFWRNYRPKLHSEEKLGVNAPQELIFGLIGLEIEARENHDFPSSLNENEIETVLRYVTWEMNGFPLWLEKFYNTFPKETIDALMKEVIWSLENSASQLLHKLVYYGGWLHDKIAYAIYNWVLNNPIQHNDVYQYSLEILLNSDISSEDFLKLAQKKLSESTSMDDQARWYALLVDSSPDIGIPAFETWLIAQNEKDAIHNAQTFITYLIGRNNFNRTALNGRAGKNRIYYAEYLKQLYLLMHQYIKTKDDNNRSGSGVYSPNLRDMAQESRDLIFQYLRKVPSTANYYVIKELANNHSVQNVKVWMDQVAYGIATSCGNLDPLSIEQVLGLEQSAIIDPKNHKELFDLALIKIHTLKDWLENGDDSPFFAWQAVENETKMRILIAGQLGKESLGKYTISQEYEIANGQRPDIRFDKPNITSVPVELKILDKQWSGNDLCERLRNQLIGDYLREETAGCGIFLLVAQNIEKTWKINGKQVTLSELEGALQEYWHSIAHEWPKIDAIKVIVIDLNKRSLVSKT